MGIPPFRPGASDQADLLAVGFSLSRAAEAIDVVGFRSGEGDTSWCGPVMAQAADGLESILGMVTPGRSEFDPEVTSRVEGALFFTTYDPGPNGLWALTCDLRSVAVTGWPSTGRELAHVREATTRLRDALRRSLEPPTQPFGRRNVL